MSHFIVILCYLQNGRGRPPAQEQWVFGMVDTSSKPAVGYMELVQDRTAATLLAIISAHVAPGTEIWSDQWASYHNVGRIPGVTAHRTVNHSVQFVTGKFIYYKGSVDLILHCFIASGVHTNTVESYWNRCKTKIKRMKGVHRSFLPSYLDEFVAGKVGW